MKKVYKNYRFLIFIDKYNEDIIFIKFKFRHLKLLIKFDI